MTFSAIDIGSNAIRLMIAEKREGRLQILKKHREPLRLGKDVFEDGHIRPETIQKAISVFNTFQEIQRKYQVKKYRALATSATREAKNQKEFVDIIFQSTGVQIEVIDGLEEANLIQLAVEKELNLKNKTTLSLDIGGGSIEVTFAQNGQTCSTKSFPLGTVRLLQQLKKRNLKEENLEILVGENLQDLTRHIHQFVESHSVDFAIGTGGNLECLGRLKVQLLKKTPNTFVTLQEVTRIISELKKFSIKQRIEKLELRPDRADVILPACLVTEMILRQSETEKLHLPAVGLRDGIIWNILENELRWQQPS